jgi:hypothetical protein
MRALSVGPVLPGTVYDPTFSNDSRNFLDVDPAIARSNFVVDLHFGGEPVMPRRTIVGISNGYPVVP